MDLQEYIEQHTSPEPDYLRIITRSTYQKTVNPRMLSGHLEGRFLSMLSKIVRPQHILELGTFTGYSALCLAEGLPPDGRLDTIEKNDELETTIRQHFSLSPLGEKIHLHIGDAETIIPTLHDTYDIIFMDADKRAYSTYYDLCLPLLSPNGIMIIDNTLWDGHIIDPAYDKDKQTAALRIFNDKIAQDDRVEQVLLPLRDGVTLVRRLH